MTSTSTCKELSLEQKKKEMKILKKKEGNFETSWELKRNLRNKFYGTVSGAKIVLAGY